MFVQLTNCFEGGFTRSFGSTIGNYFVDQCWNALAPLVDRQFGNGDRCNALCSWWWSWCFCSQSLHNLNGWKSNRFHLNVELKKILRKTILLTLFLIYSRVTSGNESHCLWYCSVMEASLLVRWFFNCRPAAVRATELQLMLANTSDNAFKNSAMFVAAACSKNCRAANNSFWSKIGTKKRNKRHYRNKLKHLCPMLIHHQTINVTEHKQHFRTQNTIRVRIIGENTRLSCTTVLTKHAKNTLLEIATVWQQTAHMNFFSFVFIKPYRTVDLTYSVCCLAVAQYKLQQKANFYMKKLKFYPKNNPLTQIRCGFQLFA